MPNLNLAFQFENGLAFSETDVAIFSVTDDPSSGAGADAPEGSLLLRSSGEGYLKTGSSDTSWSRILKNGDVVISTVQPASGLTITGGPITNSGTFTFALANDLAAIEALASTGLAVRTSADTWATRTITGTAGQITVTNGTGVSGNPTLSLPNVGTPNTYGSATQVPVLTTDAQGRVTSVTNTTISLSLNNLSDVSISSAAAGQTVVFNGTQWINAVSPIISYYSLNNAQPTLRSSRIYTGTIITSGSQVDFHVTSDGTASGTALMNNMTTQNAVYSVTVARNTTANDEAPWGYVSDVLNAGRTVRVRVKKSNTGGILLGGVYQGNVDNNNAVTVHLMVIGEVP